MGRGWQRIAGFILRQRIPILIVVGIATVFMWLNRSTEIVHNFAKIVPASDPEFIDYLKFKEEFGEDGNVFVIGISGDVFDKDVFQGIYDLSDTLPSIVGVNSVLSVSTLMGLEKNTEKERFELERLVNSRPESQAEVDSIRDLITGLPFYDGLILSEDKRATVVAATIDRVLLDTKEKIRINDEIIGIADYYEEKLDIEVHYAGLPYMRTYLQKKLPREMGIFLGLAILITAITLFWFFRSMTSVIFPLLVIGIVVIWSLGIMGLFGYKISILTALVPTLITVIGIPNSIYLLNKYHFEFKRTNNKVKSLVLVIQKIGIVTVMTNATTAVGFLVLVVTDIQMLREFGVVAGLSVVVTFFISLLLIPIIFSFLPAPTSRHLKHIDRKALTSVIDFLNNTVQNHRKWIYMITLLLVGFGIWGIFRLVPVSYMVDDLPKEDRIYTDLKFLESNFKGIMPFEIVINTRRKNGLQKMRNLKKIEEFQQRISEIPEISRTVSVVDMLKFARQSFFNGVSSEYQMPSRDELRFLLLYSRASGEEEGGGGPNLIANIVDSTFSKTRIKGNIKDVGSIRMGEIIGRIQHEIDDIFLTNIKSGNLKEGEQYKLFGNEEFEVKYGRKTLESGERFLAKADSNYEVLSGEGKIDFADKTKITGTTKIFIKGNDYLIANLVQSLLLAFLVIAVLMALLFGSLKMVLISMIPNVLPLLLTAGIMGHLGIPLKPSTALIFSVAFGISVDDTIHYLARYRLARRTGDGIRGAVANSFRDTGMSMIYTSIILLLGFGIFAFSSFGSTEALGKLTAITILIALFSNLLLLPSLLLTLRKDSDKLAESYLTDFQEEEEEIEAIKELISSEEEDGEDPKSGEKEDIS